MTMADAWKEATKEERERCVALAVRCRGEFRPGDERGEDFRRYVDKFIAMLAETQPEDDE